MLGSSPLARGLPPLKRVDRKFRGSSPLARGLHKTLKGDDCVPRIIPARAGFTRPPTSQTSHASDHPRSRGVYAYSAANSATGFGSSPLARGLPARGGKPNCIVGIIPARAGFTSCSGRSSTLRSDHPRSRGVYKTAYHFRWHIFGSSPLARGLLEKDRKNLYAGGIIPARAGFTPSSPSAPTRTRDHPRSRGVYTPAYNAAAVHSGSSPLARGLHLPQTVKCTGERIIPARAGFTHQVRGGCQGEWDHPRSRGVYTLSALRTLP